MPRAMWRGAIQFGLVTIPVRLFLATESRGGLSFNMLHADDHQRIQMKVHCPEHGEIKRSDTVRGYEWSKGQYVVLEQADFEAVPLKTVRSIEIEQFVPARRGDAGARFVKSSYYVEPEPVGRKAFSLLKSVLAESELQAVCKIVLKDREQLAALDPYGPTMLLSTLYWPDEVRDVSDLDLPAEDEGFKPAEVEMAKQLVDALTGEFEVERYKDEYREALLQVIDNKIAGLPVEAPAPEPETSKLTDLMAVLEASVAAARAETDEQPTQVKAKATGKGKAKASKTKAKAADSPPVSVDEARVTRSKKTSATSKARRSTGKSASKAKSGTTQARRKTA